MTFRHLAAALATGLLLTACGQPESTETESADTMETEPVETAGETAESADAADMEMPAEEMTAESGEVQSVADAVAHPDRPEEDKARDEDRQPGAVLTFLGVEPGMTVLEFVAAGGYYTEILARAVGDSGHVYATRLDEARIADDRLPNVTGVGDREWGLDPGSVDLVFTALNYHDLFNIENVDRPALLKRFHEVLKPGGVLAVIDHAAEEGSGERDTETLHRVDEQTVVREVTAAGFELVDTSEVLRHSEDDRTENVFAEGLRGKTDRFVLKFIRPEA